MADLRGKIAASLCAMVLFGFGAGAWGADLATVNNTDSYADPAIAAGFMTVPNVCGAAPDSTDNTTACNALGEIAVQAIQGTGPMNYFQGRDPVSATQNGDFFVPTDYLWFYYGENSGIEAPVFNNNSYNLFGRADEMYGTLTMREISFLADFAPGDDHYVTQTQPSTNVISQIILAVLTTPEGNTTITAGGNVYNISDLPTAVRNGLTQGMATTIVNYCFTNYPVFGGLCGNVTFAAQIYMGVFFANAVPASCGPGDANCQRRDEWIDQTVAGYVTSQDKNTADQELTQNFRSQVSFEGNPVPISTDNATLVDQRLEQTVELGQLLFQAGRQAMEQAFQSRSVHSLFVSPDPLNAAQLVSQDVEGYLFSCWNCDTPELIASGGSHAFEPWATTDQIAFIPYTSNWHTVPTITHAYVQ